MNGQRLKTIREELNLTQKDLADERGLVHKFQKEKEDEAKAKYQAKFEAFVGKYTSAYNITGTDLEETRRELGTLSESAIDKMSADLDVLNKRSVSMEPVVNSETLLS